MTVSQDFHFYLIMWHVTKTAEFARYRRRERRIEFCSDETQAMKRPLSTESFIPTRSGGSPATREILLPGAASRLPGSRQILPSPILYSRLLPCRLLLVGVVFHGHRRLRHRLLRCLNRDSPSQLKDFGPDLAAVVVQSTPHKNNQRICGKLIFASSSVVVSSPIRW